jgi:hypothetical protein
MLSTDEMKYNCTRFLRREYKGNVDGLKELARQAYAEGSETVTLTQGSFEGGTGQGQVTFNKLLLLGVLEDLLEELDASYVPPPSRGSGVVIRRGPRCCDQSSVIC